MSERKRVIEEVRAGLAKTRRLNLSEAVYFMDEDIEAVLDSVERACSDHDPNTGPGSDWCPTCRQYEPAVPA